MKNFAIPSVAGLAVLAGGLLTSCHSIPEEDRPTHFVASSKPAPAAQEIEAIGEIEASEKVEATEKVEAGEIEAAGETTQRAANDSPLALEAEVPAPTEVPSDHVRSAIRRSLPFLEAEGSAWMRGELAMQGGSACVSCHHVNYAVWSLQEAHRAGLDLPGNRRVELTHEALEFLAIPDKPRSMSLGPLLLGLETEPKVYEEANRDLAQKLVTLQTSSGRWRARGQFPDQRRPIAESDAVATMWSLLVLPASGQDLSETEESAMAWLLAAAPGGSNEWQAGRALLAHRMAAAADLDDARSRLLEAQNEDGGWGWLPGDASNAFSTGQAIYALTRIGEPVDADALRFLTTTQHDDGSWHVPSAAISTSPSEERDHIYRFWGTAWATIGLSRTLAPTTPPEARAAASLARHDAAPLRLVRSAAAD